MLIKGFLLVGGVLALMYGYKWLGRSFEQDETPRASRSLYVFGLKVIVIPVFLIGLLVGILMIIFALIHMIAP